jgi:hypothetical protein
MSQVSNDPAAAYSERYAKIKGEIQDVGFVLIGSAQSRYQQCGKPRCRCHTDPANRHGPYFYWTRKVKGKTVGMMLTKDEYSLYRRWIANGRTVNRLTRAMQQISKRALVATTGKAAQPEKIPVKAADTRPLRSKKRFAK